MEEGAKKRVVLVTLAAVALKVFWLSGNDKIHIAEFLLFTAFFLMNWAWISFIFMGVFRTSTSEADMTAIYLAALIAFFVAEGMANPIFDDKDNAGPCRSTIQLDDCD